MTSNVINKSANSVQTTTANDNFSLSGNIFSSARGFALAQRIGTMLSKSTIVPKDYQNNLGNCVIALEMATRMNTSPLLVMQNLYIVNGRPAWSSKYCIAVINNSHRYKTELQFDMKGEGDNLSCYAWAEDCNGHVAKGPVVTMEMAKAEGWYGRNGSKWKTMPKVMIQYRAASFFARLNCPDLLMGLYTVEEVQEMDPADYVVVDDPEPMESAAPPEKEEAPSEKEEAPKEKEPEEQKPEKEEKPAKKTKKSTKSTKAEKTKAEPDPVEAFFGEGELE